MEELQAIWKWNAAGGPVPRGEYDLNYLAVGYTRPRRGAAPVFEVFLTLRDEAIGRSLLNQWFPRVFWLPCSVSGLGGDDPLLAPLEDELGLAADSPTSETQPRGAD